MFAIPKTISQVAIPIPLLLAGPEIDGFFEPLIADDGGLADSVVSVIGTRAEARP